MQGRESARHRIVRRSQPTKPIRWIKKENGEIVVEDKKRSEQISPI